MMVEGVVEVQGTVKIDDTRLIDNYLSMAQKAADSDNLNEAEHYANKALELEPTNWAALYAKECIRLAVGNERNKLIRSHRLFLTSNRELRG